MNEDDIKKLIEEAKSLPPSTAIENDTEAQKIFYGDIKDDYICSESGLICRWTGTYWRAEKASCPALHDDYEELVAKHINDKSVAKKYLSVGKKTAMIHDLMRRISAKSVKVNSSVNRIAANNGIINLQTGELEPHDRKYYFTHIIDANYDDTIPPQAGNKFYDWLDGRTVSKEITEFLLRWCGYSVTAETKEQHLLMIVGQSNTGKSLFQSAITSLFSNYCATIDQSAFHARSSGGVTPELESLVRSRLSIVPEMSDRRSLDTAALKRLTGNDSISINPKYRDTYSIIPRAKIWFIGNSLPSVGDDEAFFRRPHIVRFDKKISFDDVDDQLHYKFTTDPQMKNHILRAVVHGAVQWYSQGMNPPASVRQAADDYRASQNAIAEFIEEYCVVEPTAKERTGELNRVFNQWQNENQSRIRLDRFANLLEQHYKVTNGVYRIKGKNTRGYKGIRLKTDQEKTGYATNGRDVELPSKNDNDPYREIGEL